MNIDVIGHRTQRRGMTLLAPRLFAPPANHRRLDPVRHAFLLLFPRTGCGGSEQFLVLLLQSAVLCHQFLVALLHLVDTLGDEEPLFSVVVAVSPEKVILRPQRLHFPCALLVEF